MVILQKNGMHFYPLCNFRKLKFLETSVISKFLQLEILRKALFLESHRNFLRVGKRLILGIFIVMLIFVIGAFYEN